MIVLFTERLGIAPVVGVWGKRHEVPCHPQLEGYLQAWLRAACNLQSTSDLHAAAREHQAQIERDVQPRAE
jgi:hypothetical protein